MTDLSKIVSGVVTVATKVAQDIPKAGVAFATAKLVLDLVRDLRTTAGLTREQAQQLDGSREELEAAVHAHAGRTSQSLGD